MITTIKNYISHIDWCNIKKWIWQAYTSIFKSWHDQKIWPRFFVRYLNLWYCSVLLKWEFFIKMRASYLQPSSLQYSSFLKKGGSKAGSSHFDEKFSTTVAFRLSDKNLYRSLTISTSYLMYFERAAVCVKGLVFSLKVTICFTNLGFVSV